MPPVEKLLYTAKTHTTGGRDGASRSSDGRLDIKLSVPGTLGNGTNPEQLLAAGWSACFTSAMKIEAGKMKVTLPAWAGRRCGSGPLHERRRLLPPGSSQRQPAGLGTRSCQGAGGCRGSDVSLLQSYARQHRSCHQPGLAPKCNGPGLPELVGQIIPSAIWQPTPRRSRYRPPAKPPLSSDRSAERPWQQAKA